MAHPKKARDMGAATAAPAPTAGPSTVMTKSADKEMLADYAEMVGRRDSHLAGVTHDPRRSSSEIHIDAATWEEWLDGNLGDEYIQEQLRNHSDCKQCRLNYEHYNLLKNGSR